MGTYTTLYTSLDFYGKTYNYKEDVESDYEDATKLVNMLRQDILNLVMITEPKKFVSDTTMEMFDDPLDWMSYKFNTAMKDLQEAIIERANLKLLLDEWDKCHDKETGLAIEPPDEITCKCFLNGDFVKTNKTEENN